MTEVSNITATATPEAGPLFVADGRGRKLFLKKPNVLAQFRLVDALGPETGSNPGYLQMVSPLLFLDKIDEEQMPMLQHRNQIEGLISRLDNEGMVALTNGVRENFGAKPEAQEAELSTAKKIVASATVKQAMWLVMHGMPFHTAFGVPEGYQLSEIERAALSIICTESEGWRFNWKTFKFEAPPK